MPSRRFDLINSQGDCADVQRFAIEKGSTYDILNFMHSDDLSTWTACGEIRDNYAHLGGVLHASFNFRPFTYGSVTLPDGSTVDRTLISAYLTDEQTSLLPILREYRPCATLRPGFNCLVYDIKMESPAGEVYIIVRGFVQVLPDVSQCL